MNLNNVEFLISAAAPKDFPKSHLPEIAFAGKSNVVRFSQPENTLYPILSSEFGS